MRDITANPSTPSVAIKMVVASTAVISFDAAAQAGSLRIEQDGIEFLDATSHNTGRLVIDVGEDESNDVETLRLVEEGEADISAGRTVSGQDLRRR